MRRSPEILACAVLALVAAGIGLAIWVLPGEEEQPHHAHEEALKLAAAGRNDEAATAFRRAIELGGGIDIHRDYQNHMRNIGRVEEVRAEYRARAEANPRDSDAQYLQARLLDPSEIEAGMKRVLALDANHLWSHRALGVHYGSKSPEEALRHRRAAAEHPQATSEDAGRYVSALFQFGRYDDLDRVLASWADARPAWSKANEPVLTFTLARSGALTTRVHVALDPTVPFALQYVVVRENDGLLRVLTMRSTGDRYALSWTPAWRKPEELTAEQHGETWQSEKRPTFAELRAAVTERLAAEKK